MTPRNRLVVKDEIHVLLVDDDPEDAEWVGDLLQELRETSVKLTWKSTYEEGLEFLWHGGPNVAVVDYRLGARSGIDFTAEAGRRSVLTPIILLTSAAEPSVDLLAMKAGAVDFLSKRDLDATRLGRALRYAVARQQLKRAETRYRSLVENSHELISILDADGSLKYVSPSLRNVLGYEMGDKLGGSSILEVHPDDREEVAHALHQLAEEPGEKLRLQYRVRHADGSWRVLDTVGANQFHVPEIAGIVLNSWDVTEQYERQRQLQFQSRLLETVGQALIATDAQGHITFWNAAAEELYGWGREEVLGQPVVDVTPADLSRAQAQEIMDSLAAGHAWTGEFDVKRRDGSSFRALVTNAPVDGGDGGMVGVVGASSDITEFKRTEAALEERVKELRTLYRASEVLNLHQLPLEDRFLRLFEFLPGGWLHPELTEIRLVVGSFNMTTPGFRETPWMMGADIAILGEVSGRLEVALTEGRAGGEKEFLEEERELLFSVAELIATAVSRRRIEEKLLQSQKMEAVGLLAGGIAHDFNNLLTVIRGQTDLVLMELDAQHEGLRAELQMIQTAADRATLVTSQLLAFSREQVLRPRVVDACETVHEMARLLGRFLRENIPIEIQCGAEPILIEVDPVQLEQVLMNLAVNARDAMPSGGTLTFAVDVETEPISGRKEALLRVVDTGAGMDELTRRRIFEPFFTTKPKGKGTGLGLAMVYGFMAQSGGTVTVDSAPGEGTTFTLRFPVALNAFEKVPAAAGPPAPPVPVEPEDGGRRILVVEDSPEVLRVVKKVLERNGFTVYAATDAESGVETLESDDFSVDAVLTDLILPGAGGRLIVEWVKANRPYLPVIVMSGYSEDNAEAHTFLSEEIPFLQKPFTPAILLEVVRAAIRHWPLETWTQRLEQG